MTALREALNKVGFDPTTAELCRMISEAMVKCHRNYLRALHEFQRMKKTPEMQRELERYYFMNHLPGKSQSDADTQHMSASPDGAGGDQLTSAPRRTFAATGLINVRKHKRSRPRTTGLRTAEANVRIDAVFKSRTINGRYIGMLAWGELTTIASETAIYAASPLQQGKEMTETALLLHYLRNSYQVEDHSRLVHEVVSPTRFAECEKLAKEMAPLLIARAMQQFASTVKNPEAIDAHP